MLFPLASMKKIPKDSTAFNHFSRRNATLNWPNISLLTATEARHGIPAYALAIPCNTRLLSPSIEILTMSTPRKQHSANVDLRMTIDERVFSLTQVGPNHAILERATSIPPDSSASIDVLIDDKTLTREVILYDGASDKSRRVEFF